MRVLTLAPYEYGYTPGQRSSIEMWEEVLEQDGIKLHYVPFETQKMRAILYRQGHKVGKVLEMIRAYRDRLSLIKNLDEYDAVFVYREAALIGPAFLEKKIAKTKPIIYQLDDPLFMPYVSPTNGWLSYLKFFGKIKEICQISKVVMVNSTPIRDYVSQFASNIWQVPSLVDERKFPPIERTADGEVCVGWSGSHTTTGNLGLVRDALYTLQQHGHNHRVQFIGGEAKDFELPGVNFTAKKWAAATEVADLQSLDIGLVPLPVNEWNKRKFNMKTAQYMMAGVVPICTPMGENPVMIQPGVNGFLADSTEEWVGHTETLIKDPDLRLRMSRQAVTDAKKKYSLQANRETILGAFRSARAN